MLALVVLWGCRATVSAPDLGGIYNREAQYHEDRRNPVIVIPGILASPIRWTQVIFLFSNHLGITKDPVFTDNVLYLLLEDPRRG